MLSFRTPHSRRCRELRSDDLLRLSQFLESSLKSGATAKEALHWLSQEKGLLAEWAKECLTYLQKQSWEEHFQRVRDEATSLSFRIFLDLLSNLPRHTRQGAQSLRRFSELLRELRALERETHSAMAVPRIQAMGAGLLAFIYILVLPGLFPTYFASFWSLGLRMHFVSGVFVYSLGLGLTWWLSRLPFRHQEKLLKQSLFLHLLSYHLESGSDFARAWELARQSAQFDARLSLKIAKPTDSKESLEEFLKRIGMELPAPWPELSCLVRWALRSGLGMAVLIRELGQDQSLSLIQKWRLESKSLSVLLLLPLGLICFPASLFLILGPQFVGLL
jgi:Flp pilus assembly protein TadB